MHTLVGIDRDPMAHSIAEQTLQAASAERSQPLDIRQLQAGSQSTCTPPLHDLCMASYISTCGCGVLQHRWPCFTPSAAQCINLPLAAACVLQGTFSDLSALLEEALQRPSEGVADGILLDLGMSSMQAGTLWTSPCRSAVPPDNFLQPGVEARGMPSPKLQHPWHCFRRACLTLYILLSTCTVCCAA